MKGSYKVQLPDGRTQIVRYIADHNGYKAEVSYEMNGILTKDSQTNPRPPSRPTPIPAPIQNQQNLFASRLQPPTPYPISYFRKVIPDPRYNDINVIPNPSKFFNYY